MWREVGYMTIFLCQECCHVFIHDNYIVRSVLLRVLIDCIKYEMIFWTLIKRMRGGAYWERYFCVVRCFAMLAPPKPLFCIYLNIIIFTPYSFPTLCSTVICIPNNIRYHAQLLSHKFHETPVFLRSWSVSLFLLFSAFYTLRQLA